MRTDFKEYIDKEINVYIQPRRFGITYAELKRLRNENEHLKSIIKEVREELNIAYNELLPNELVNGRVLIENILDILDKVNK